MKKNNKGFSYVEMIMVLGVMAIMIAMVSITIGAVRQNNIYRASEKLEALVNKARVAALTKGSEQGHLSLVSYDGTVYGYVGGTIAADNPIAVAEKGDKICSSDLTVSVGTDSLDDGFVHSLDFIQSTGGVKTGTCVITVSKDLKSSYFTVYGLTGKTER